MSGQTPMIRAAVIGLLLVVILIVYLPAGSGAPRGQVLDSILPDPCPKDLLCVSFLDVGQGDAFFIESPTGYQVLIDGGRNSDVLRELPERLGFFDRQIDMIIATHPDADHIGGLVDVLARYDIATVMMTNNKSDTPVADAFEVNTLAEGATMLTAARGKVVDLGGGAKLEILFPEGSTANMESNTSSIVAKLTHGESTFLFTGDSPKNIEEYLVIAYGEHLESDVLKVGHHGSRTSTSELFLAEVAPEYAIVSAGKDNQYGHPHVEVTDLLFNYGVGTLSTAEEGTITFFSDGSTYWRHE